MEVDSQCKVIPNSGVKIGYGVDLSLYSKDDLLALSVSQTIVDKLK